MRTYQYLASLVVTGLLCSVAFLYAQEQELPPENHSYKGDLNEDGKVDIFDLLEMLNQMKSEPENERQREIANTDNDPAGEVDIFDLLGILKIVSGKQEPELINWGIPITMVSLPGGTFQMGTNELPIYTWEYPEHTVTISPFQISAHEITNTQYVEFLNQGITDGEIIGYGGDAIGAVGDFKDSTYIGKWPENALWYKPGLDYNYARQRYTVMPGYEDHPVAFVTWYGAKAFALKYGFDLPTEAEWEYAARGGKQYEFATDDGTIDSSKANYLIDHSVAVGTFPPNPFGLYNMAANVAEWCNDKFDVDVEESFYTSDSLVNPIGPDRGKNRIYRGGAFKPRIAKTTYPLSHWCQNDLRWRNSPNYTGMNNVGFRVVYREPQD